MTPTRVLIPVRRRGFTLVELMISIALVLLLVLGINQVFKLTSETVGAGQAASAAMRDQRATANTLQQDFAAALTSESPFFVIHAEAAPAFRNRADELSAVQYGKDFATGTATKATLNADVLKQDLNANGKEGETTVVGEIISPLTYNNRNHRLDAVTFLARGNYARQTGNPGYFTSPTTAGEAMITYAHGLIRNNMVNPPAGTRVFYLPGEADLAPPPATPLNRNDNNKYASQFALNRSVMLLLPTIPNLPAPNAGFLEPHMEDVMASGANRVDLSPLSMDSYSTPGSGTNTFRDLANGSGGDDFRIFWSRYDQARTSVADFAVTFASFVRQYTTPTAAYQEADQWYRMPRTVTVPVAAEYNGTTGINHYDTSTAQAATVIRPRLMYRSFVNPRPGRPLTDLGAAQAAPYFLGNCSQFIIEFAGDFVRQDNDPTSLTYGQIVDDQPDGEIDYILVQATFPPNPITYIKQTRWYGMPRDTGTDPATPGIGISHINDPDGAIFAPYGTNAALASNRLVDVLPLRDVLRAATNDGPFAANPTLNAAHTNFIARINNILTGTPLADLNTVEHNFDNTTTGLTGVAPPFSHVPPPTNGGDYASTTNVTDHNSMTTTANAGVLDYSAVWTFGGPKMVRVIATVDDPGGRLPNGQTFQYVFSLRP